MGLAPCTILHRGSCANAFIHSMEEAHIRSFGVGLIALATVAAAGILLRYRRLAEGGRAGRQSSEVEALYAAGL